MTKTQKRNSSSNIDGLFNAWLNTQNKMYSSPAEMSYRRSIFAANYEKVTEMNKVYSHTSALNKFADLTEDEFVSKYTGYTYRGNESTERTVSTAPVEQGEGVDWRTKGAVNPVKDQRQCGSCWAFSATSAIESSIFLSTGKLLNLAEQQMVDCGAATGNHGCNGGWMDYAFEYIIKAGGQELTTDYPYTAKDSTCKFVKTKSAGTIKKYTDVAQNDCNGLVKALNQQPVSVAIAANAIMNYQKGVFKVTTCGTGLNHGVTAVGYGTDGTDNWYIVRNSWGAGWGENGYIRMSRDVQTSTGICGICMVASYPTA
jgi:C1A family cysteine protease